MTSGRQELDPESLLENAGWVRRVVRRMVIDDGAADDVVQDTLHAALASPPREPGALRSWLRRVATNFALRDRRSRATRRRHERGASRTEALEDSVDFVERAEMQRRVVKAVLDLEEPYRSTVLLRFFGELNATEIADRMNVPASTVRVRLKRALDRLRDEFREPGQRLSPALLALLDWKPATTTLAAGTTAAAVGGMIMGNKLAIVTVLLVLGGLLTISQQWGSSSKKEQAPENSVADSRAALLGSGSGSGPEAAGVGVAGPPGGRVTITGRVIDLFTADPVPSAAVTVLAVEGWRVGDEIGRATADDNGEFTVDLGEEAPDARELEFLIQGEGYEARNLRLSTRDALPDAGDLELQPGVSMTGEVVREDGTPVAEGEVWPLIDIVATGNGRFSGSRPRGLRYELDGQGRFEAAVNGQRIAFVAHCPGYALALSEIVAVEPGGHVRIVVRPGRTFRGMVRDSDGQPISGASVHAFPIVPDRHPDRRITFYRHAYRTTTDEQGSFAIADAPDVVRQLEISHPDHVTYKYRENAPTYHDTGPDVLEITLGTAQWLTGQFDGVEWIDRSRCTFSTQYPYAPVVDVEVDGRFRTQPSPVPARCGPPRTLSIDPPHGSASCEAQGELHAGA